MTFTLAGYQISDLIYEGSRTLVYRGFKPQDCRTVVLKKLRKEYHTFSELLQFRHQYVLTKNLYIPGVVQPISLEQEGNGYVLVMEDVGGISLVEYAQPSLGLDEFLSVAIALIEIIENIHKQRIIHKDIKPANILINPETKKIFLIDFSIASLLPKETQQLQNPHQLEGTLAYISPEQTGRMNRGIDYRSDFYGLGVTFYQLLTGKLPFESSDPMELVHSHIAKIPSPPHLVNPQIPKLISDIITKLMAKNAEERYQSARGIKYDLNICWQQWQQAGKIIPFQLSSRDLGDRFLIPEKLYGRETEVQTLLSAFDRVAAGSTEMILVSGFSGIGKTAIVNEVHKPIVEKRGYFIKGKFDQFNHNIPFSALAIALRDLMGQLLGESDAALEKWKQQILAALGEQANLIIEVIPELENIIGEQPEVSELSGSAAQNRFNLLFGKFIQVFTTKEHPLVIFLDDLQWADSASLKLMELLIDNTKNAYLLLVGAYRDNEVYPGHPLVLSLESISHAGTQLNPIHLSALSKIDINYLVADTLSCGLNVALPLTELVYQKSKGNPFFSSQFLKSLYEDGLIEFNLDANHWQCDIAKVKELAISDDVVEFMADRISKLPPPTQQVLKLAACLGNQFDLATLAIVNQESLSKTAADLWQALEEGLILPTSQIYNFFAAVDRLISEEKTVDLKLNYKFLHDRVQQAAYSLIPESQKKETYLKIGRMLLQNTSKTEREENIFALVNQLNYGIDLLTNQQEKNELAILNLKAGQKAKEATAYEAAVKYFHTGISLLAADSWHSQAELTVCLYLKAMEAEYLNTNFATAQSLGKIVLSQATNSLDRVKVHEINMQIFSSENQNLKSIELGMQALGTLGISLENVSLADSDLLELPALESVADLPEMEDLDRLAALRILVNLLAPVLLSKPEMLLQVVITQVNLCIEHGHSALAALSYSWYGMLLCGTLGDIEKGYHAGQLALQLLERFNQPSLECHVYDIVYVFIKPWKEHIRESLAPLLQGVQMGLEFGDLIYASYCGLNYCSYLFSSESNLQTITRKQAPYIDLLVQLKNNLAICSAKAWHQFGKNLQGLTGDEYQLIGNSNNGLDEDEFLERLHAAQDFWTLFNIYLLKGILCYLFADYETALVNLTKAEAYTDSVVGFVYVATHKMYYSLVLLSLEPDGEKHQPEEYLAQVNINQEQLHQWAIHAPMNFQHKYDLVAAEKCRVLAQHIPAIELYDRAIASAEEHESIADLALANERAALFYFAWGKEKIASSYMTDAYHCYARWGAKAKTDRLEATYPQLLTSILQPYSSNLDLSSSHRSSHSFGESSSQRSSQSSSSSSSQRSSQSFGTIATVTSLLDLNSAIKASRAISGEIELNALLSKLMYLVLENAGADTGALLLNNADSWAIAAWCDRDGTHLSNIPFESSNNLPSSIINTVKRTQQTILIHHVKKDPTFAGDPYLIKRPPQCLLCTPILHIGQLIGILYLENHLTPQAFTPGRIELLNLLIAQAAISIKNAKLYEQVEHYAQTLETQVASRTQQLAEANIILRRLANLDGLTQVANRRSFDTYLQEVWLQAEQTQQPLTLMLSDVDCFKLYNDRYGHQAGDRVLQQIAKTLEQAVADPTAQVARYGGEEFAVILPRTDRPQAIEIASRILIAIRSLGIPHEQSLVKEYVTLSMGVCSLVPNSELNWPRLIQMADEALYEAKQQGRDRFVGRWVCSQN